MELISESARGLNYRRQPETVSCPVSLSVAELKVKWEEITNYSALTAKLELQQS